MSTVHQARALAGTECLVDARGDGRAMVVRWAPAGDEVVLSLWRGAECVGTFRLARREVPALVATLRAGLAATTR